MISIKPRLAGLPQLWSDVTPRSRDMGRAVAKDDEVLEGLLERKSRCRCGGIVRW